MIEAVKPFVALLFLGLTGVACGGSQPSPEAPSETAPAGQPAAEPAPSPNENAAPGTELTAEACEASGGTVVGDIGDGAIHRPDYKCPSGSPPSGKVVPTAGGPISVEGSVCCPK